MGTYTELVLKCRIKAGCPELVHQVLNFMFGDSPFERPETLPHHKFFKSERWESVGRGCSYYHIPVCLSFYDGKHLFSRSDLKNYHGEIDLFIDWLKPYISNETGQFIGWIFCENSREPIFIYSD